ncbi:MAG: hypothetical protein BWY61_01971 [Firmicutes bacterium ADurb.Bin354]|nr:MAG: hypothetical protein BWY61_01971 [Firmicutes bacterium ADurb.Bin354]
MELVDTVVITDDVHIVESGDHFAVSELHLESDICLVEPRMLLYPGIDLSLLEIVFKYLSEKSEMIAETYTVPGESQSCDGIKEACCKPSKAAVSKRRFGFGIFNPCQIFSLLLKDL